MPIYHVKCSDSSDRNCKKTVDIFIDINGLTKEQLNRISECYGSTTIELSRKQIEQNKIDLSADEKIDLEELGYIEHLISVRTVCGPCGSGETYSDNGNNITAL